MVLLTAEFHTAPAEDSPVTMGHMVRQTRCNYQKMGKPLSEANVSQANRRWLGFSRYVRLVHGGGE